MSLPTPQNNRLDFLRSENSSSPRSSEGWNTVQRRRPGRYQKNQYNSRRDGPDELPTHSSSRDVSGPPQPKNDRLEFLQLTRDKNKKKTFVAMCSEKQWDQGFRPAWILESGRDPPEKYMDAVNIFKNYMRTGEIIIPRTSYSSNSVKSATASYHYQNKAKKDKK